MFFLGNSFFSDGKSMRTTPSNVSSIIQIKLQNGIYDELYVTKDATIPYTTTINQDWNYDTILHALFNGNLRAGNVDFQLAQVSSLRIKRRKKNEYEWTTIFEVPITKEEDLRFTKFDRYAQSGVEYEYISVPVLNNVEGNGSGNTVLSEFEGIFVLGYDKGFNTVLHTGITSQKNRPTAIINTIDRKYPYVVSNGMNNYYSGTTTGMFLETETDNFTWKYYDGWKHRQDLMEFLCDGRPKILKHYDGRIWMITVTGTPSEAVQDQNDIVITSFDWVETDDINSTNALYNNGFSDVNIEGR